MPLNDLVLQCMNFGIFEFYLVKLSVKNLSPMNRIRSINFSSAVGGLQIHSTRFLYTILLVKFRMSKAKISYNIFIL